jgi:hypothetical protein
MGEAKRKRRRTIGEHMELRPGEPMVLKVFSGYDVLDLVLKGPSSLDEEAQEKAAALQALMQQNRRHRAIRLIA